MNFERILKAAESLANFGRAASRLRAAVGGQAAGTEPPPPGTEGIDDERRPDRLTTGSRVFGQIEARLAGVLVSALKEAFDRDRAHLEMEREQIEHERRRSDELMRLELLRQAGERELHAVRSGIAVALVVWMTSVVFLMLHRAALGVAGLVLVGAGWTSLVGALGLSFAAHRDVSAVLLRGAREPLDPAAVGGRRFGSAVPVLIVVGIACTAASLLVALAT